MNSPSYAQCGHESKTFREFVCPNTNCGMRFVLCVKCHKQVSKIAPGRCFDCSIKIKKHRFSYKKMFEAENPHLDAPPPPEAVVSEVSFDDVQPKKRKVGAPKKHKYNHKFKVATLRLRNIDAALLQKGLNEKLEEIDHSNFEEDDRFIVIAFCASHETTSIWMVLKDAKAHQGWCLPRVLERDSYLGKELEKKMMRPEYFCRDIVTLMKKFSVSFGNFFEKHSLENLQAVAVVCISQCSADSRNHSGNYYMDAVVVATSCLFRSVLGADCPSEDRIFRILRMTETDNKQPWRAKLTSKIQIRNNHDDPVSWGFHLLLFHGVFHKDVVSLVWERCIM